MAPRYDWWGVQAIHPNKTEPFDLFINKFPTEERAREVMADLERQGYEHINLIQPDHVKRESHVQAG